MNNCVAYPLDCFTAFAMTCEGLREGNSSPSEGLGEVNVIARNEAIQKK